MITKINELKTGDIAILRNGDKCIYIGKEVSPCPFSYFMSISEQGCFLASSFKEGLKHVSSKRYDIIKIYRNAISFNLFNGNLIYDRVSFSYKELKTGDIVEFSLGDIGVVIEDKIMLQGGGSVIIKNDNIFSSTPYGRVIKVASDCKDFDAYDAGEGKVIYEEE
jgi:hypothetical protein